MVPATPPSHERSAVSGAEINVLHRERLRCFIHGHRRGGERGQPGAEWSPVQGVTPWLVLLLLAWPAPATADVVMPGFKLCPWGHTLQNSHGGPYCLPPQPRDCKPGEIPTASRAGAFCDPPPARPCPVGSMWRPSGWPTRTCITGNRCLPAGVSPDAGSPGDTDAQPSRGSYRPEPCSEGTTCRQSSLCVKSISLGRRLVVAVSGTCTTDADCPGARPPSARPEPDDGQKYCRCLRAWRCDPDRKRGPDDRTDPGQFIHEKTVANHPSLLITPVVSIIGSLYLLGLLVSVAMILWDRARRRRG